jgi:hypothetical protein
MKPVVMALALGLVAAGTAARADDNRDTLSRCLIEAAQRYDVPTDVLVLIYLNEGGTLGKASRNSNGTYDLGPFQVNDTWLPRLARHWDVPRPLARALLLGQFCANADAAAWILRLNLNDAGGDVWEAVGLYHSATPDLKRNYLTRVYRHLVTILQGKPRD